MPSFPWNYAGDPASSDRDAVRFLVGDTIKERPLVFDKEVDYALTTKGSVVRAAAFVCDALAAKFSSQADCTIGPISKSYGDMASKFTARSKELRADANVEAEFFFGGTSHAEKRDRASDPDEVQPAFRRDQGDNYRALSEDNSLFNFFPLA